MSPAPGAVWQGERGKEVVGVGGRRVSGVMGEEMEGVQGKPGGTGG